MRIKTGTLIFFFFLFVNYTTAQNKYHLIIEKLTPEVYLHISYNDYKGSVFSSNGLFIVSEKSVIVIDTPWDTLQTKELLFKIDSMFHKPVVGCIISHAHDDRIAGIGIFHKNNIPTYGFEKTCKAAIKNGFEQPKISLPVDTTLKFDALSLETFYPGPGHTDDNIVIWNENYKILYGGCLIKTADATSLGNLADANTAEWKQSLNRVQNKFPKPKWIIVGHGSCHSLKAIKKTLQLLQKATANQ